MNDLEEKTVKLKNGLTLIAIEEGGSLLDVDKRCYYDLNDTAFFLARRMEEGCRYQSLAADLISEFYVDQTAARIDIENFIDELLRRNLVLTVEGKEESVPIKSPELVRKPYQAPALEYQKELAVASGSTPLTPDV